MSSEQSNWKGENQKKCVLRLIYLARIDLTTSVRLVGLHLNNNFVISNPSRTVLSVIADIILTIRWLLNSKCELIFVVPRPNRECKMKSNHLSLDVDLKFLSCCKGVILDLLLRYAFEVPADLLVGVWHPHALLRVIGLLLLGIFDMVLHLQLRT